MLTKGFLSNIRREALRKKIWYKVLDSSERGILSLAAKIINTVKSTMLHYELAKIIAKLKPSNKNSFTKLVERFGMERVKVVQEQAKLFGYKYAESLSQDLSFVKYLMLIDYYQIDNWRIYRQ